jgi:hypothetical protein
MAWLRLSLRGRRARFDEGIAQRRHRLAETVVRIGRHEWPLRLTPAAEAFLEAAAEALGIGPDADVRQVLEKLGPLARMIGATVSNTSNPTLLNAGYKVNVIPGLATAGWTAVSCPGTGMNCWPRSMACSGPVCSASSSTMTSRWRRISTARCARP